MSSSSLPSSSSSSTTTKHTNRSIVVDPFCYRQFAQYESSKDYGGTVFSMDVNEFTQIVNDRFHDNDDDNNNELQLVDGYASFCKHLFLINNFTSAQVNVLPITPVNEEYLRTKYEARNDKELPVLVRYFPKELVTSNDLPVAKYLDLILYSREQIQKENAAMMKAKTKTERQYGDNNVDIDTDELAPWRIVSIKAQDVDYELPMTPITAMRNALGTDEGGSGIPLDRNAYMKSYDYWKDHAIVS